MKRRLFRVIAKYHMAIAWAETIFFSLIVLAITLAALLYLMGSFADEFDGQLLAAGISIACAVVFGRWHSSKEIPAAKAFAMMYGDNE
jgi:hypothetical protein